MAHYTNSQFQRRFSVLMAIFALLLVFVLPFAIGSNDALVKATLASLPAVPVVLAIVLWARQVLHLDELEQRIHVRALSVAAGVVSVASIVAGLFLVAFGVHVNGGVLFWVFGAMAVVYGFLRKWMKWRYTGSWG